MASVIVLWLGLSALATPAAAQDAEAEARRHLDEGRASYSDLDFAGAIEALRRALAVPGVPDGVRLEAYEYLGAAYVVLEQEDQAREALLEMFAIDPYHVVREPSGSPKIARFVARVRGEAVPDAALDARVQLRAQLPRGGRVGRGTRVRFTVTGPARVARVRVFVRGVGDADWETVEATRSENGFVAELPARSAPDELALYAEGRDSRDRVVTRAGEPFAPLALEIVPGSESPGGTGGGSVLGEWWFWTAIGVVIAGAVIIGIVATSGAQAPDGTLPPGRVELP